MLDSIIKTTLANGVRVLCFRKPGAPVVSVQVWYGTGSACEPAGLHGVSHVVEHLMFRGSRNVGPEMHARRVSDAGGHCNAFTAEDVTTYVNSVPCGALPMVLDLEADRMTGLQIDESLFEIERKVILEEYQSYMNNPVAKALLEFRQELFAGHPYELSPLGRLEDISSMTIEQCRDYYRTWYTPSNALVVVVGDIDSEQETIEAIAGRFGALEGPHPPPFRDMAMPTRTAAGRNGAMKRRVEFDLPILVAGFPAPSSSSPDALPLEILQQILAGGETCRLHAELVRRRSVAVMAGGMNHLLKYAGMTMFFAAFTPDIPPHRVEKAVLHEIARLRDGGLSPGEFEKVKNMTLASRIFESYSAEHLCQRIASSEMIEGDYRHWVSRLETLEHLDTSELTAVARTWWDESQKRVLVLQPRRTRPLYFFMGLLRRVTSGRRRTGAAS
jgi:zinc protease